MIETEREKLLNLEQELHKRVVGQEEAVEQLVTLCDEVRAGLTKSKKTNWNIFIFRKYRSWKNRA